MHMKMNCLMQKFVNFLLAVIELFYIYTGYYSPCNEIDSTFNVGGPK